MGEWLEELKNMGKTIVIVSHDVEFCALFADKCGLIFDRNIESYTDSHSFFAGNIFSQQILTGLCPIFSKIV